MTKITKSSIKRYAALFMLISFVLSVVSPALATAKIENDTTSGASGTGIRIYDDSLTGIEIPEAVGEYSVSMGYRTCSTGDYAVSMGYGTISSGYASTAMGYWSMASEYLSTAMGMATTASGRISTAMGCTTIASGEISTAMGDSTIAGGYASTATGYHSEAHGSGSFSGGGYYDVDTYDEVYGGKAYGNSSFAFGSNAVAGKIVSEAVIDPDSYNIITPAVYGGHNTFAFGSNAKAAEDNTIAFGSLSLSESAEKAYYGTYAQGVFKGEIDNEDLLGIANNLFENAIESGTRTADEINALKNAATVEAFVSGMDQFLEDIGIGMDFVTAIKSTGYVSAPEGTTASGENAIAIGNSSKVQGTLASGKNSMALGNDAQATHDNSVALGSNSVTTAENTISVGYVGGERRITNVAAGVGDTDAVNFKQMKDYVAENGGGSGGAWTADVDGTSINVNADKPTLKFIKGEGITLEADAMSNSIKISATGGGSGSGAIAGGEIPDGASAAKANENGTAVASGYDSQANAENSVANGFASAVSPNSNAGIAIGKGATVGYEGGTTSGADMAAIKGIAIGENATVTGEMSTAIGYGNIVTGKASGAFGDPNIISGSESYAIGNNNEIAGDNNFVLGSNVKITDKNITNSVGIGHNTTVTESNVVSVGSSDNQRRIVNVADGINPTDAANMRQLEAVSGEVREVGAISAALAGLHFVEPSGEGDDKLVGAVAYGGYRGESAAAIGVAYKPSPNLMLSASTSIGNSQNAYNAGVSYKFGKGETAQTKAELQKQVKYLNGENAALKDRVGKLESEIEELKKLIKK